MENKVLKLGGGRSTQDVYAEIRHDLAGVVPAAGR